VAVVMYIPLDCHLQEWEYLHSGFVEVFVPFYWDFDQVNGILRFRLAGRITDEEVHDYYREASEIALAVNPRAGIMDLSDVISLDVSRQTISNLAKGVPILPDPERPRIVIASSTLVLGITRMFLTEGEVTRPNLYVVQTQEAAWAILGVKDVHFGPYNKK